MEHMDKFWYWLKKKGLDSHRSGIVLAIAEKADTWVPGELFTHTQAETYVCAYVWPSLALSLLPLYVSRSFLLSCPVPPVTRPVFLWCERFAPPAAIREYAKTPPAWLAIWLRGASLRYGIHLRVTNC